MPQDFSKVGQKLTSRSGILLLMDDLGRAMAAGGEDMLMLGGGNPAAVPAMQAIYRNRMAELLKDGDAFDRMLANYDPPQGNPRFIRAIARLLSEKFSWSVSERNVAVTNGSQSTFFYLFAALAGTRPDGTRKKILLPLSPEYIGYADQGLEEDIFASCKAKITWPHGESERIFKYTIDFAAVEARLKVGDIAAMAVSRPTNPSGNMVTQDELHRLSDLADRYQAYLIVDCAYGAPFPGVIFGEAKLHWSPRAIHTFSLSKMGLPGVRTGIIVGPPEIIEAVAAMNAIVGLATGNVGQQLALHLVESREILEIGPRILQPFYEQRRTLALAAVRETFNAAGIDWAMHANEGSFFFWLWFRGMPITTQELYRRLKDRKVLIVPGEYYFFGLAEPWDHQTQCIRMNFAQPPEIVREGVKRIAEEVAAVTRGR